MEIIVKKCLLFSLYTDYQYYNQGVKVSDVCERHTHLFPFLRLSYNKDISVSLSYTNSITRPQYSSMTNMLTYIDSYTAYQGNPNLKVAYRNVIDAVVSWIDSKTISILSNSLYTFKATKHTSLYNVCKRASQNYWLARFVFLPICINFAINCNKPLPNAIYTILNPNICC